MDYTHLKASDLTYAFTLRLYFCAFTAFRSYIHMPLYLNGLYTPLKPDLYPYALYPQWIIFHFKAWILTSICPYPSMDYTSHLEPDLNPYALYPEMDLYFTLEPDYIHMSPPQWITSHSRA
ncbi:hypothetical protein AVEN_77577-1 [Araneus ventricosus]|uniref:Uncharacterized protein n=1 Tax=Araneus ventricosus TaxID=182803 RepID=A0A4Y2R0Q6_ARAVE|nr:hypothetical protein AVEN_77577-1 [Araneus ventricosus]